METQGITRNRRFIAFAAIVAGVAAVFIVLNAFVVGGTDGVLLINNLAAVIFSWAAFFLFLRAALAARKNDGSDPVWGQFAAGLLLWALAETLWAYYEVILAAETPYPSFADVLWLLGYLPLGAALITRYRAFNAPLAVRQRVELISLVVIFILLTANFLFRPMLMEFDPGRLIESILNILYSLADLCLLIFTLLIFFSLGRGRFIFTWGLIATGLLFVSISDLFYSYMFWYGYYFPQGEVNAASIIVPAAYNLSYLWMAVGIYAFSLLLEIKRDVKLSLHSSEFTRSKILVIVNRRNQITLASENFALLAGTDFNPRYVNVPLHVALGVSEQAIQEAMSVVRKQGSIRNHALTVGSGGSNKVFLSALALINPQNEYYGAGLVFQARLTAPLGEEPPLTEEQNLLVNSFLSGAGIGVKEDAQVLKSYFIDQVRAFYSLVYEFNGEYVANSLLSFIEQKAAENGWVMHVDQREISIPEDYEGQILIDCLKALLKEAKAFAVNSTSSTLVEHEVRNIDRELGSDSLRIIDRYGFRMIKQFVV